MPGNERAGGVDLGTVALGIGVDDTRGGGPVLLLGLGLVGEHQAHVIGVADGEVAGALEDRLDLRAVAARGRQGEVVADGGQPVAGLVEAPDRDAVGDEPDVVDMVAGRVQRRPFHSGLAMSS
jgi:hypothetical protein